MEILVDYMLTVCRSRFYGSSLHESLSTGSHIISTSSPSCGSLAQNVINWISRCMLRGTYPTVAVGSFGSSGSVVATARIDRPGKQVAPK